MLIGLLFRISYQLFSQYLGSTSTWSCWENINDLLTLVNSEVPFVLFFNFSASLFNGSQCFNGIVHVQIVFSRVVHHIVLGKECKS